ncbi:MAG TPA: tyrosinase family protein, partial [Polyangium sp.]|nr:tyrosinase family protein [Polyangium sp.]
MSGSDNVQALPAQTINLAVPKPSTTTNLALSSKQGAIFRSDFSTWSLAENGGSMQFNLTLAAPVRVSWSMSVCAALVNGVANNPISITVNGFSFIPSYSDHNANFHNVNWTIPPSLLRKGNNNITITLLSSASSQFFINSVTVATMPVTRNNAWNNKGTFDNPDLLWYAKAVGVMMSRQLKDPTSWWFFAAIHGQYIVDNDGSGPPPTSYPNWAKIPYAAGEFEVPTSPLPESNVIAQYWDQCQHAGWYFAPWHRGYLYALENILSIIIQQLGGPASWALPYWNYLDSNTTELNIPPAFTADFLPDGKTRNPLKVTARYGPKGNGEIYVSSPPVNQDCQKELNYADDYGGGQTGFAHFAGSTGYLESNPHNIVHGQVGGRSRTEPFYGGLMGDPGLAGLDPIFYLHHCNIDRLWAAWNKAGKANPKDSN